MANEKNVEIQDLTVEELQTKANNFFEENKVPIIGGLTALIVLVLGIYYYTQVYAGANEKLAQTELYKANIELQRDSFLLALNGRTVKGQANNFIGYTGIIEQYSGTDAANLAHYYAGAACLRLDQHQLALTYLGAFSGETDMQTQAYNMMGDAASSEGSFDEAAGYYQKGADNTENVALKLYSLFKKGKVYEKQDKKAEAVAEFEKIMAADSKIGEGLGVNKDIIRLK